MEELSVMGIAEVLPKYRALKRRIAQAAAAALDAGPMRWSPSTAPISACAWRRS
jgi:hypothetical protein